MSQSIESKVVARIYGHGRGWAFSPKDFQDLGRVDMPPDAADRLRQDPKGYPGHLRLPEVQ